MNLKAIGFDMITHGEGFKLIDHNPGKDFVGDFTDTNTSVEERISRFEKFIFGRLIISFF